MRYNTKRVSPKRLTRLVDFIDVYGTRKDGE